MPLPVAANRVSQSAGKAESTMARLVQLAHAQVVCTPFKVGRGLSELPRGTQLSRISGTDELPLKNVTF